MAEYIERADVLWHKTLIPGFIGEYVSVRSILEVPAADVAPVRHARWERYYYSYFGRHQCVCSECKDEEYWKHYFCFGNENYCPHCGCKMDLEVSE